MKTITWKKRTSGTRTKYTSACGRYRIDHTGCQGRSTRIFTAYVEATGEAVKEGGLKAVKEACERRA